MMRIFRNKTLMVALAGLLAAALVWTSPMWIPDPVNRLNTLVFDSYQRIKPRIWADSPVVIVDIDERSIAELGQWPWPRTTIAQLVDRLGELGAAVITFDMVFSEPDRTSPMRAVERLRNAGVQLQLPAKTEILDNDLALAEAIRRNVVVAGFTFSDSALKDAPKPKSGHGFAGTMPPDLMVESRKAIRNLPALEEAATGLGHFTFPPVEDAVVRRVVALDPVAGRFIPSLAMESLRVAQGAGGFKLKSSDASGELSGGVLTLVSAQVGAFEVPTDHEGALNIYHSPSASKPTLSVIDILDPSKGDVTPEKLIDEISGHIVLIGTSAQALLDLRATPLEPSVAGVTLHAEMIDQIISGSYLSRPDYASGVEISFAIIASLILVLLLPKLSWVGDALATSLLIAICIGGFWYAFSQQGILLSPVLPVGSILMTYGIGSTIELLVTEKEGRFVREAFGHYLAPSLVKQLADDPDQLTLGGEDRELTLLFCDIRGFTSLSEGLNPTELTTLLNNFLTPMTDALLDRGATIDKYMGDAIMAFWNAPIFQDNHHQLACEGVLAMRKALIELNRSAPRAISIGIGVNTGPCCVGNLGSRSRFNYSAIGDAVNVASRIEGQTKFYGLDNLVSEETLAGTDGITSLEIDLVGVVGREAPLSVHTLIGMGGTDLSNDVQPLLSDHRDMLRAYRSGDVDTALNSMGKARALAPAYLDKFYEIYAERLEVMRQDGVPEGWDGVYRATEK